MAKRKSAKAKPVKDEAKPRSFVTFLLDRSGSMDSIRGATIEGFNTYLTGLQSEERADIRFTFLQFDTESLDKVHVATPVKDVPLLTNATFIPRGGTPLIDATYKTIKAVEEAVAKEERTPKVVICVQTDGFENSSKEHTWASLSALVKAKQEAGWQFNFLGAGIDAYHQAAMMGVSTANTVSYESADMDSTRSVFRASSANASSFASGRSANTSYTIGQKRMSGDKFVPKDGK